MSLRGEEHRALRALPDELRSGVVKLNEAARERGGESLFTPARVKALGEQGVQKIVSAAKGDPTRAARLIAQQVVSRVRGEGEERER